MSVRLVHDGDGGDCIAALPILRQLGGGQLVLTQGKNPRNFRPWFDLLRRLCESTPYVESIVWEDHPGPADYHIQEWRKPFYDPQKTLTMSMAASLGIEEVDMDPWLYAHPSAHSYGRVVVARSERYHNPVFPWRETIKRYGPRMIFVGIPREKQLFDALLARVNPTLRIEFYRITDFLDLAELIAGCSFFVGNQSSPGWVAMGLGKQMVQETSAANNKDSMVPRDNAQYVATNIYDYP